MHEKECSDKLLDQNAFIDALVKAYASMIPCLEKNQIRESYAAIAALREMIKHADNDINPDRITSRLPEIDCNKTREKIVDILSQYEYYVAQDYLRNQNEEPQ